MASLRAIKITTNSPRKPLKSISNKKRQLSPTANRNSNKEQNEPPNKKQKISKSEQKQEESDFLSNYTLKTRTIKRIFDNKHFDDDEDDEDDKSIKLKFNLLSHNKNNKNKKNNQNNWIRLSDIFSNAFKYSSTSNPTLKQIQTKFIDSLNIYLKRNCISYPLNIFYRKLNKKYYISEKAFCILLFIMNNGDTNNLNVSHFISYRFYYRNQIFGTKISKINIKKPQKMDIEICNKCCLEDIQKNFEFSNPCDCGCILHLNCNEINAFKIPNNKNKLKEWFCPFCISSGLSTQELIKRRNDFNENGEFEIEQIIYYDIMDDKYVVKWKNYPNEACSKSEISLSFIELINIYWENKQMPLKVKNSINSIMKNENLDNKINEIADAANDCKSEDIEMKCNDKFIGVRLDQIMDRKCIIRRQKYTKETYARFKLTQNKYRKWMQREVKNESLIGMDIKREMKLNKSIILPKYHLRSINNDWDCDLPRIHDIIINFLNKDWNKWCLECDVSNKSFVIGEIIDMNNPAKKYGYEDEKAYGLFAVNRILKDTLLFEYSGVVKRIGDTSKYLNHLETELEQTTLFDLIGHLDSNRNKLFWGAKPNDQLVIDPSQWHNEGIYMNDYRDRVMDDPDDDEFFENENNEIIDVNNNCNENNNKMRKQNVKFYEVIINNWPRVFAVAIEDIKPGQELLGDYGKDFWSNFRVMVKRQKQLNEIKKGINDKWKEKYDILDMKYKQQEKEIQQLKKELHDFI